ncbi:YiiX/YebB-like N1pC/P60 family cysteine hydrolase [Chitinilyticum piscinae]|uniref:Poxvirus G6 n=1 Tax=Chitinilyticum piscinae TaxID=2866724 RepID=A0A8J7K900_9NEIS|nr:YiiX/YebB-like N1pC/P60 family cysteine hydrolase [Chitinilyticum piscinae]MBE9610453.1 hypothetical protein [Chitinilyticum piscinae]
MWRVFTLLTLCFVSMAVQARSVLPIFQKQVGDLVELRSEAYRFAQQNGILTQKEPKLTRAQSNQLRELAQRYINLRAELLPNARAVAPLFQLGTRITLTSDRPTGEDASAVTLSTSRGGLQRQIWINPEDRAGRELLLDIQYGLTTALVLMDSYQIAVEPYASNKSIDYLLTYDVKSDANLRQLADNYHSTTFRTQISSATRFIDEYMAWRRKSGKPASPEEDYLYSLTQSTVWYVALHGSKGISVVDRLNYLGRDLEIRNQNIQNILSQGLSMGFGNMVGVVQTRNGKLSRMSAAEQANLAAELKPLDILLEKTPFRLTDKMIPGHYGHVAIWLGSEAELREMGVWERIPSSYQQQIRQGGRIVEALRSGVTISTLEHFLNIDDLLVLRDRRPLDTRYRQQAVLTALEQVGKEYDFNFDVMTHERIVCSELAYVVFPDVAWPLERTLGRYTISPDNVAQLAISTPALLDPVILYRDGTRSSAELREQLRTLIGTNEASKTAAISIPQPRNNKK